jgi:hypothetical protein
MAPHLGLGKKKKKADVKGAFSWFESTVNGGVVILTILQNAANFAPVPYLRGAASTTLALIQIGQAVKDNKADFRRLCEDAATLTVVVYESRERSEDPDGWPGAGMQEAVENFLSTLNTIAEFAQAQVERGRFVRVVNSIGDGLKIREFRERLAQAMNRFEVSAHLQSYEVLRLMKNMMENYQIRLSEKAAAVPEDTSAHPLPVVPSEVEQDLPQEQEVWQDEELAERLPAAESRQAEEWAAEREARKREQEAVNEKLQQILRMMENVPPPIQSSSARSDREDSSDDEKIVRMAMKNAADSRADRESRRKDVNAILNGRLAGLNLNGPAGFGYPGRGTSRGPARVTSSGSGNINSSIVYGSHNDNSTVTRINKVK